MYEKVNPSHPDKLADRIAGALVDLAYARHENPRVAVEVLLGHGSCKIITESSYPFFYKSVEEIVDRIVGTHLSLDLISVPQDSFLSANQRDAIRCGDNGIFCGVSGTDETRILTSVAKFVYDVWHTDGKYIINTHGTVAYPRRDLVICQSELMAGEAETLKARLIDKYGFDQVTINPLGYWTGGPNVDCGATNRKLGSDMGQAVTGGGLHGKDLSKADVSVNIWCHLEAIRTGHQVKACCAIGDETVNGVPYSEIVETARAYIKQIGGFEKFAEWGLIQP